MVVKPVNIKYSSKGYFHMGLYFLRKNGFGI